MWVFKVEITGKLGFGEEYLTLENGVLVDTDLSENTLARLEKSSLWTHIEEPSKIEKEPVEKVEEEQPKPKRRGRPRKGAK